mmetsp:Transcript_6499/g.8560  ORF Transcript_6499/g.8560 Transcript_6499/m.8560 type:complete len:318 (-) Transcript_6499:392-1345(-)|eukprot:CAMPEP_0116050240 /NCGR_PEP_ID=MMETSP0322-20121206/264_1 /TAXON_ID=163516 /ORGANISM="Leptocylindrus danicus var. apora, Strain B651" /LENGTH=317 /DNA_ID=CAMNT_0003532755 /DNA_START=122 /DNA_END=1075 /DNA_ORIENTATION=+
MTILRKITFLLYFLSTSNLSPNSRCRCNAAVSSEQQYSFVDEAEAQQVLEELTIEELEAICTSRGFYLQPEEGLTKDQYTHEDYVDAAIQCLAIEAEIEQAIAENPEVLDELKHEAERMQEEKERLEAELLRLLKEQSEAQSNDGDEEGSNLKKASTTRAFVNESALADNNDLHVEEDEPQSENSENETQTSQTRDSSEDSLGESSLNNNEVEVESSSQHQIITAYEFLQEFRAQVTADVQKVVSKVKEVIEFLYPIVAPVASVAKATFLSFYKSSIDMAKRYGKSLLANLQTNDQNDHLETCQAGETSDSNLPAQG